MTVKEIQKRFDVLYSIASNMLELLEDKRILVIDYERRYTLVKEQLISLDNDYKGHIEEFKEYAYYIEYILNGVEYSKVWRFKSLEDLNEFDNLVKSNCRINKR